MSAPHDWPDDNIILYDGVCALCSGWVSFVMARDESRRFRFTPIQSPYGAQLAERLGIDPSDPDTNAVLIDGHAVRRSDAAIVVLSRLRNWRWTKASRLMPRAVRDWVYDLIARNRYRVFGVVEACDLGLLRANDRIIIEALPPGE
jgi:predicted DCC family thiol-disulfide oxidoreductase YuxK